MASRPQKNSFEFLLTKQNAKKKLEKLQKSQKEELENPENKGEREDSDDSKEYFKNLIVKYMIYNGRSEEK